MGNLDRLKLFIKAHRTDILVGVGIFVLALLPRAIDLGVFLTADEKNWMGRSFEFIRAFKDVRLNDMLQTTHPGVTALWMIGVAITAKMFLAGVPFSFQTLPVFVTAAQFSVALANALVVPVVYFFLRKLFSGRTLPVVASLLIALNPFIIGYSRVAHVDALLMSFLFLAVLATIIYGKTGFSRRWLVVSAVFSALAMLTKAPAVFMIPFFWLVMLAQALFLQTSTSQKDTGRLASVSAPDGSRRAAPPVGGDHASTAPTRFFQSTGLLSSFVVARLRDFLLWLIIIAVMVVIIWPVFITVPNLKGNADILRQDLGQAISTPHHMSADYQLEGGRYFLTILARTTPVTLLLLVFCISYFVFCIWRRRGERNELSVFFLLGYVFFFVVMMTLGAKKGDRYILPIFPAIDVLAAIGIWYLVSGISRVGSWFRIHWMSSRKLFSLVAALCLFYLSVVVLQYHPYAIAYSNPIFPDNLSQELGWGEGLDQVAAWLNENDPTAFVASWYDQELAAFTNARVASLGAHEQPHIKYVVLYRNMFGRAPDHPANDYIDEYYKKREPVFVAEVIEKPFAWVYEKQTFDGTTGELLPGVVVLQEDVLVQEAVAGVEVLVATYNGRAQSGSLVVELRDDGMLIHRWEVPVIELEDDAWLKLLLPEVQTVDSDDLEISVAAIGTSERDAPTIRLHKSTQQVAVRLLYDVGGEVANEEHVLLLQD